MNLPDSDISLACHGGEFITLDSLDNVAKNEISYVLKKYELAQKIKNNGVTKVTPFIKYKD